MKKQSLSISIPEPCHEKWSTMTPVDKGRHCKSCQKTVVDFTRMPKVEIVKYVSAQQGMMCGRFTSDQLNVELIPPKPTKSWLKYAAIILGLVPTLGYGQEVDNQQNPTISHINNGLEIGEYVAEDIPKRGKINLNSTSKNVATKLVKGILVDDESEEPLLFGTVALYKNRVLVTGVETDLDGRFTIEVPEGAYLEATYIGYEPQKINITDIDTSIDLIIRLKINTLMGGVEVLGMYEPIKKSAQPDTILQHQLPTVELVGYRPPLVEEISGTTFVTTTGIMVTTSENWFQRQWRKLKNLIKGSHSEALKSNTFNRINSIQNRATNIQSSTIEKNTIEDKTATQIEIKRLDIKVYPNPTLGFTNITIPNHVTNFTLNVSDMKNELVLSKQYFTDPHTIDLSSLIPGSYIISIIHEGQLIYSEMLVKM